MDGLEPARPALIPQPRLTESEAAARPTPWTVLFWLGLAMCGSTLLLATTNQISQEIAVVPFLWVAPLSIYLLTFILAFEHPRWYRRSFFAVAAGIFGPAACAVQVAAVGLSARIQLGIYLLALFVVCMVCPWRTGAFAPIAALSHGLLSRHRGRRRAGRRVRCPDRSEHIHRVQRVSHRPGRRLPARIYGMALERRASSNGPAKTSPSAFR